MPMIEGRKGHNTKVYRPNGTRYSEGRGDSFTAAIADAMMTFVDEFGRKPRQETAVIEACGSSVGWTAAVLELPE